MKISRKERQISDQGFSMKSISYDLYCDELEVSEVLLASAAPCPDSVSNTPFTWKKFEDGDITFYLIKANQQKLENLLQGSHGSWIVERFNKDGPSGELQCVVMCFIGRDDSRYADSELVKRVCLCEDHIHLIHNSDCVGGIYNLTLRAYSDFKETTCHSRSAFSEWELQCLQSGQNFHTPDDLINWTLENAPRIIHRKGRAIVAF